MSEWMIRLIRNVSRRVGTRWLTLSGGKNVLTDWPDAMATMLCKVQYLDDTDPFSSTSTNFPEPTRPPTYTFLTNVPLQNQLAGVKRLLKAPHKVSDYTKFISKRIVSYVCSTKFISKRIVGHRLQCSLGNYKSITKELSIEYRLI